MMQGQPMQGQPQMPQGQMPGQPPKQQGGQLPQGLIAALAQERMLKEQQMKERQIAMQMQQQPTNVVDQNKQELHKRKMNEMMQQQKGIMQQAAMARQQNMNQVASRGSQPPPQKPQGMAQGGVVRFAGGTEGKTVGGAAMEQRIAEFINSSAENYKKTVGKSRAEVEALVLAYESQQARQEDVAQGRTPRRYPQFEPRPPQAKLPPQPPEERVMNQGPMHQAPDVARLPNRVPFDKPKTSTGIASTSGAASAPSIKPPVLGDTASQYMQQTKDNIAKFQPMQAPATYKEPSLAKQMGNVQQYGNQARDDAHKYLGVDATQKKLGGIEALYKQQQAKSAKPEGFDWEKFKYAMSKPSAANRRSRKMDQYYENMDRYNLDRYAGNVKSNLGITNNMRKDALGAGVQMGQNASSTQRDMYNRASARRNTDAQLASNEKRDLFTQQNKLTSDLASMANSRDLKKAELEYRHSGDTAKNKLKAEEVKILGQLKLMREQGKSSTDMRRYVLDALETLETQLGNLETRVERDPRVEERRGAIWDDNDIGTMRKTVAAEIIMGSPVVHGLMTIPEGKSAVESWMKSKLGGGQQPQLSEKVSAYATEGNYQ